MAVDLFPIWKRYVRAVEQEFIRAGFPGASQSVVCADEHRGSCVATWRWPVGMPSVNAQAWPEGITLTWSSAGRWTYSVLDDYGLENTLELPVPSLAAPSALGTVLPALMDGRHGQLPASEERWEHAGLVESRGRAAAAYGDDKYDDAYQTAEEEAETFLRWQEELDGEEPGTAAGAGAGLSEEGVEPAGLTRYRVLALRTDEAHPGAATLTNYTEARSVEEALAKVRRENERPGGLYGEQGLYRVVEVTEEGPAGEVLRQEAARRTFVDLVMNAARAEMSQEFTGVPHSEMFGILCDFFTRAIVFPGQFAFPDSRTADDEMHTSDPARALSRLLLQHLNHHALDLVEADDRAPSYLPDAGRSAALARDERLGFGQVVDRDGPEEGSEASPELIEQVQAVCETHYAAVTGTSSAQWDTELSRELVGLALRTVHLADRETYPQVLDGYLRANRPRLENLWRIYGPESSNYPRGFHHLVELPESFVLCERIAHAPLWLEGVWEREGHEEISLSRLKKIWLYGTNEKDGR